MTDTATPADVATTPEQFEAEVVEFLTARRRRRATEARRFTWGEGSDRIQLFEESDAMGDGTLAELLRWRDELWAAGLGWITGPVEYGGRGLPDRFQRQFDTIARQFDVPSASPLTVSLGMVAPTILAHATEQAKAEHLAQLYRGAQVWCQLFSEPGAGSDLASVATAAVPVEGGWRITGQKVWTSGAHYSTLGLVLCRTAPEPRYQNLTMLLIDMRAPGVEVRPLRQMTGGAAFNEVFLNDVFVPESHLLAGVGDGWEVARTTLANERRAIGSSTFGGVGVLSQDRLVGVARAFGKADDPVVRQELATLLTHLKVAKLNAARAAALGGRHPDTPRLTGPIAKLALGNNFIRLAAYASHVLGPRLTADTGEWGSYAWRDVVLGVAGYRIGGGTDEIMRNVIAERVLGLPRDKP
jgi:alkylation response protein AidB-like acyl-CoA dehydrogenase